MSGDNGSAAHSPKPAVHAGVLAVHVGAFGGPPRLGGGMGASNAPESNAPVSVVAATGRTWTVTSGRDGIASLSVPAGQYRVSSPSCGSPHRVTVVAGKRAYAQIVCVIP
jgi:hypothetical protein